MGVELVRTKPEVTKGSAGLGTRVYGGCVTVSAMAAASGGIGHGGVVSSDNK